MNTAVEYSIHVSMHYLEYVAKGDIATHTILF